MTYYHLLKCDFFQQSSPLLLKMKVVLFYTKRRVLLWGKLFELENNVEHGTLSFLYRDIGNLFVKVKKNLVANDVKDLLEYMKFEQNANSKFRYAFTVDEERRLEHLFWSPSQCFDWYESYGDVVLFDTSYKVNAYDMPCGIFVGVNNHGKTILFGCALLHNKTTSAFKWLMKVCFKKYCWFFLRYYHQIEDRDILLFLC